MLNTIKNIVVIPAYNADRPAPCPDGLQQFSGVGAQKNIGAFGGTLDNIRPDYG
jgi:hypothetical protein